MCRGKKGKKKKNIDAENTEEIMAFSVCHVV